MILASREVKITGRTMVVMVPCPPTGVVGSLNRISGRSRIHLTKNKTKAVILSLPKNLLVLLTNVWRMLPFRCYECRHSPERFSGFDCGLGKTQGLHSG